MKGIVGVLLVIGILGCARVETGQVATCRVCGREMQHDVRTVTVAAWKKDEYGVRRESVLCDPCGDQSVAFTLTRSCQRCKKTYDQVLQHAPRRTNPTDQTITDGYCPVCNGLARLERGIDRGSEAVGDFIGRVGSGITRGINKHR